MNAEERVQNMGTAKLLPLILVMSVPAVCGNIVNALYNIVDRIFVGRIVGGTALGAVGVMFPLNNIIAAFTVLMSIGGGALVSLSLGRQEKEKADKAYTNLILFSLFVAVVISSVFFFFAEPLIEICGADESSALYEMAVKYLRIIAVGQLFGIPNLAMAACIRAEGNTRYAMIVTMAGAGINVCMDAIFMMGFHGGVEGAAAATVISQIVSCGLSLQYHCCHKGVLRWKGLAVLDVGLIGKVISLGLAPAVFQGLSFCNNTLVNHSLMRYANMEIGRGGGDMAISAVSVIHTVENFAAMFIMGMNSAISTIISYNYGLKQYGRAKEATLTGQAIATVVSTVLWTLMMAVPETLFRIFSTDVPELIAYGARAMRMGKLFIFGLGFQTLSSMYYSAIGKPKRAIFISISRNGLFLIPALLLLPGILGLDGVLISTSVSDALSLIVVSVIYWSGIHDLNKLEQKDSKGAEKEAGCLF